MMLKSFGILLVVTVVLWGNSSTAAPGEKNPTRKAVRSSPGSHRQPNKELGLQLASSIDAGDAYRTPTGSRKLRRLAGAIALPSRAGITQPLIGPGGALAGYTTEGGRPGGFSIFRQPKGAKSGQLTEAARLDGMLKNVRATAGGKEANPVYIDPQTGLRLLATTNLIVCLKPGVDARAYFGATWKQVRPLNGTSDQFLLTLTGATAEEVLAETTRQAGQAQVQWAEPDFVQQMVKSYTPNDPRFPDQWHLFNDGQYGATPGADAKLAGAWDITLGNSNIVVAIIDDGGQINHPDLAANIFKNPGEVPNNGVDDDNNGIIDDVNGWDFYGRDGDPSPEDPDDNHGTALAGVIAAVGNNGVGVSGAAPRCRIMPLKVLSGSDGLPISEISGVLRYAAGLNGAFSRPWRGADIINISLLFSRSTAVDSALADAATRGRGGRGCPIFCAAGNSAAAWRPIDVEITVAGSHTLRWEFSKDQNDVFSIGADTAWLDAISYPDGEIQTFESAGLPAGWTTGGDAAWTRVTDGVGGNHAMTGWDGPGSHALRAGRIGDLQSSWVEVTKTLTAGVLTFWSWTESEAGTEDGEFVGYDGLNFYLDDIGLANDFGVPILTQAVGYPANSGATMAVGASTDFDFRSDYSQFGVALDFVAPSDGGYASITTTDRTGADGYNQDLDITGDYTARFGGTSSASPLAAGIGALMLSANPYLTSAEIRTLMRGTCDRIGTEPYDASDRNLHYGSGRLNATNAVSRTLPNLRVTLNDARDPVAVGDLNTYTLVVRNVGSSRSGPLRITHQLPAGVEYASANPAPASRMGHLLTFTNSGLESGGGLTFSILATNTTAGIVVSTATVTNDVLELSLADNTATATTLVTPVPLISISDVAVLEGNGGTSTTAVFHVTLSNPSSRTVAVRFATSGQTATSGRDFAGTSGRLVFAPGETNKPIHVRVTDDLADEDDETLAVTLSAPTNAVLAKAIGVGTILDNDPLPSLSINNVTVTEGNGGEFNAIFRVKLAPASGRTVSVSFATASGSAVQGTDFLGTNGLLTFLPGQLSKTITVRVLGDVNRETNEEFFVNLSEPSNAGLAGSVGTGTILNNDATPKLSINDALVREGDEGRTNALFEVRLAPASGLPVSVWWFATNGTATATHDYAGLAIQLLTFAPGETNQFISVAVHGDGMSESNETFAVRLLSPTNATLARALGFGVIVDDDLPPVISISDAIVHENPNGPTNASFLVRLSEPSGRIVSAHFATATNSARAGTDFVARSGTVTFPPDVTNQIISITINRDTVLEEDETFSVNLTSPMNAILGDAQGQGTILSPAVPGAAPLEVSWTSLKFNESSLRLRFPGTRDQRYRVECRLDLRETGAWRPVPGAEDLAGADGIMEVLLPVAPGLPQCFFRVRVQAVVR